MAFPPGQCTSPQLNPCHRLFDQDGHQDLAPCDFWLFPKLKENLRGCRYETSVEIKETVTKVIDTLTQEDFYWAFHKLLERYNKGIAAGGYYFEGDESFMCVLSIKVPIRKKYGNLLKAPRIYIYIYIYIKSSRAESTEFTKSLSVCPYRLSFSAGFIDYISCPHTTDACKSLLVGQH